MAPACDPTSARSLANAGLPTISDLPLAEDPFTDLRRNNASFRRSKRSTLDDMPMSDYVSTSTERSREHSHMTGLSNERHKETRGTALINNDASLEEIVVALSPEKAREILITACTPSKDGESGIQVPTNSPSSNVELTTRPATTIQESSPRAEVDGCGRALEQGVSSKSTPSSQISPNPAEVPLPKTVTTNASPADSIRGKKRAALDHEDLLKSHAASFEVKRSTRTSFRVAVSSTDGPILISSDTNRPRSDSNGSKRKRSSPSSPEPADSETDPCSPSKKASREA